MPEMPEGAMTADDLNRRVADELEVRNLIATLAILGDGGDLDEYSSLFTEDARWEMKPEPGTANAAAPIVGRVNILSAAKRRRADGVSGPGSNNYHCILTSAVTLDGDRATAITYFAFLKNVTTTPNMAMFRIYRDKFVRTREGWRVVARYVDLG
jgi:hypothetical protein